MGGEQRDSQAQSGPAPEHCDKHDLYYSGNCWKCTQEMANEAYAAVAAPHLIEPQVEKANENVVTKEQVENYGIPEASCNAASDDTVESALVIIAKMRALVEAQPENHAEFMKMLGAPLEQGVKVNYGPPTQPERRAYAQQILDDVIEPEDMEAPAAGAILRVCLDLARFLMGKNKAYGNSALEPLRIFSKADPAEQLRVRLDDKLSRLMRGAAAGEDALHDLVGYWVLLKVAERAAKK